MKEFGFVHKLRANLLDIQKLNDSILKRKKKQNHSIDG